MTAYLRIALLLALAACLDSDAHPRNPLTCTEHGACDCADGAHGTAQCAADGSVAVCVCAAACPAVASEEYCDGLDNDCNGVVDDGEVCPDPTVANTEPLAGSVYVQGTTVSGSCDTELQPFWPRETTALTPGGGCRAGHYQFRRSDDTVFLVDAGLHVVVDTAVVAVATPPCNERVSHVDFDGAGTLHYQCDAAIYRAGGAAVAQNVRQLVGVLDDGRIVVTVANAKSASRDDYAVLDTTGHELSRQTLDDYLGGGLAFPDAGSVVGNHAYVAYWRLLAFDKMEIIVFRVDERSQWQRVRRVEIPALEFTYKIVPDGALFVYGTETDHTKPPGERITAYLPDGTSRVVWRETGSKISSIGTMLLGP